MTNQPISIRSNSSDDLRMLLLTIWGFAPAAAIESAERSGLFGYLVNAGTAGADVRELAMRAGWSEVGTRRLIELLAAIGIAEETNRDRFRLTDLGKRWFDPASGESIIEYLPRLSSLRTAYADLDSVLKTGEANAEMLALTRGAFGDDAMETARFSKVMRSAGAVFAPEVADHVRCFLPAEAPPQAVLDVGSGVGNVAVGLIQTLPAGSTVYGFDRPGVVREATAYLTSIGESKRVLIDPDDWFTFNWSARSFDIVVLSQVLHENAEPEAAWVLEKASQALNPGGLLLVVFVGNAVRRGRDKLHAVFSLNMLVESGGFNPDIEWVSSRALVEDVVEAGAFQLNGGRCLWIGKRIG